ncbi:MAG: DUF2911 domain-containing protein [Bacteroidota bacterium]
MKKVLILTCLMCGLMATSSTLNAQIKTPAPSPMITIETAIGLTDVMIEYSRPSVKGRTIFAADGLTPFGKMWRTGANASTKISFSSDVKINGQTLPKGKYALYSKPGKAEWEMIFYKNTTHWGTPREWKAEDEALRFTARPQALPMMIETFTILPGNNKVNSADISIMWEKTMVSFTVETDVETPVLASIEKAMAGTSRGDYYTAARYYYDNGKDLSKAHGWVKKANEIDAKFWQLRLQSLIEAKMGDKKSAIATAKRSIEAAQAAGNEDYVRMNNKSITEWGGTAVDAMKSSKSK